MADIPNSSPNLKKGPGSPPPSFATGSLVSPVFGRGFRSAQQVSHGSPEVAIIHPRAPGPSPQVRWLDPPGTHGPGAQTGQVAPAPALEILETEIL